MPHPATHAPLGQTDTCENIRKLCLRAVITDRLDWVAHQDGNRKWWYLLTVIFGSTSALSSIDTMVKTGL